MNKRAPGNGIVWRDGRAWVQCGPALVEIKLVGLNGKPTKPKEE